MKRFCGDGFGAAFRRVGVCSLLLSIVTAVGVADATQPAGWRVELKVGNAELVSLSEEALVDELQRAQLELGRSSSPPSPFWPVGGQASLGGSSAARRIHSPASIELVRRGLRAVPVLLKHVDDPRPTQIVLPLGPFRENAPAPKLLGDEYEARDPARQPAGTSKPERIARGKLPFDGDGIYRVKVGDLCFDALGQIVARKLHFGRSTEVHMVSGDPRARPIFEVVNSPLLTPALATAAREDWGGLSASEHERLLLETVFAAGEPRPQAQALHALLYYYPAAGAEYTERLLRRKVIWPKQGEKPPSDLSANQVLPWAQTMLVGMIGPFRWKGRDAALLELFRSAAAQAEADLQELPENTWEPAISSLNSTLAHECAKGLAGRGHDEELRRFFTTRIDRITTALRAHRPTPGKLDSMKTATEYQRRECEAVLAVLEGKAPLQPGRADAADEWANVPADPNAKFRLVNASRVHSVGTIKIQAELQQPEMNRISQGRIIVTRAQDDQGVLLQQYGTPMFNPVSVGRVSDEILRSFPHVALETELTLAAPKATTLTELEGHLELVVPDLDADARVVIQDVNTKFGAQLDAEALRANGLSVVLLNQLAFEGLTQRMAATPSSAEAQRWADIVEIGRAHV